MWLLRRRDVPAVALAFALFGVTASVQPGVLTSTGLDLTLLGMVPLVFASMAQMIVMAGGDIDLSLGSAMGLVNAISATAFTKSVWLGAGELVAFVLGYVLMGAIIELRRLPALIVTFAFGFIWLGFALVVLPTPGGTPPGWMSTMFSDSIPGIPEPILLLVVVAAVGCLCMQSTRTGRLIRSLGNRRLAVEQFAARPLNVRLRMYLAAGVVLVLGGFALTASSFAGDPNAGQSYLLLSVAAVVIGGGDFAGGPAWPIGAVAGAVTLGFVASLDSFFQISANLLFALQGVLLILALGLRRVGGFSQWLYARRQAAVARGSAVQPYPGGSDEADVAEGTVRGEGV